MNYLTSTQNGFFIKDFGAEKILSEMTVEEILQGLEEGKLKRLLEKLSEVGTEKLGKTPQKTSEGQQEE